MIATMGHCSFVKSKELSFPQLIPKSCLNFHVYPLFSKGESTHLVHKGFDLNHYF